MLADIYKKIGFSVCHQLQERSFIIGDVQMPVCARDTGLFVGFLLTFLLLRSTNKNFSKFPPKRILIIGVFACLLWALDGVTSYLEIRETTNMIRLLTGLPVGSFIALILYPTYNELKENQIKQRILGSNKSQIILLLILTTSFLLIVGRFIFLQYLLPAAIILGILSAFILLNLTIARLFKPLQNVLIASSLVLTLFELSITYKLHSFVNNAISSIS